MAKVFVGLSGGVDSAVSAALLKEAGHEVFGAFIKIWQPEFTECSWREDRLDAMRVAARLGIPFREVDLSDAYKTEVVEEMIADYARGITPNPDVLCNRAIKFGHFSEWALSEGAEYIATGHYARIRETEGDRQLLRGVDVKKDQSYFLHRLGQKDLARTMFPIGHLTKDQVRGEAKRRELPVAKKHDSQGLCFVGDVSIPEFLSRYIPLLEGVVINMKDEIVGTHSGAALYTLGQRHGFKLDQISADSAPQYVVGIDTAKNVVRVSGTKEDAARSEVPLLSVSWVEKTPSSDFEADTESRYHETPIRTKISLEDGVKAVFSKPRIASPGQSLVIYEKDVCLGGGTIAA